MKRITLGQYYPSKSILHSLDARIKLIGAFAHIAVMLMATNFIAYGVAAIYVVSLIKLSKVPPRLMFRGLRAIIFMLLFAVVINLFLAQGSTVLVQLGFLRVTREGLLLAAQMALRLSLLIIGSSLLTLTTSPLGLTDGIEALLKPLKAIKVPAHDIAMMMSISLRFIPTLAEEMAKIMNAQKARGASFDTGNIVTRARSLLPIMVPLFVSAFKRAEELATAMEARCYRGDVNRTRLREMKMTPKDWIALGVTFAVAGATIATRYL